ncbi:radical SAM protein [Candidatus Micrarchaeota archaeon]|nr:radical SAM protein [Candidatus Micrarchaeota archaeon]
MTGVLVYRFASPHDPRADIRYVNVVPGYSCTNNCRFCSRKDAIGGRTNIYEKKAGKRLWLEKAPKAEEVMRELETKESSVVDEIAFVGLGEPLLQFDLVKDIIARIRENGYCGKIRVDTNGLVKCWRDGDPAQELRAAGLDEVRISMNAVSADDYIMISRPGYEHAFTMLCGFASDCIGMGIRTRLSFVVGFGDGEVCPRTKMDYLEFAKGRGVSPIDVIFREFVPPMSE